MQLLMSDPAPDDWDTILQPLILRSCVDPMSKHIMNNADYPLAHRAHSISVWPILDDADAHQAKEAV